ncbi:MAG: hypothetical protein KC502_14900 [Myxococcales bacterium]|nr:hypothetical protein [Myxococcales bacterium]
MWRNDPMALGCATLLIIGPNLILIAIGDLAQPHEVRAIFRAVNPLDASTLAIVPALWETLSPGLIVLTILGIAVGHTHPIRTGMLALSGLALFRAHYAAGHDGSAPFEMVRYQTFLLPALALVAVHGWRYVQQLQLSRPLRVTVAVVVVAALFSNPGRLESQRLDRNRTFATIADPNTDAGWLSMEMQRQVRFLAAAIAKRPQCSIIIPTAIPHDQPGTDIKRLVPGGLIVINGASAVQYEETTVAALRTSVPALQSGCVHYHVSLDCHQVDFTGCEKSWMKGPVVDRSSFPYEGFSEPREHGIYDGRIELRLHDISSQ